MSMSSNTSNVRPSTLAMVCPEHAEAFSSGMAFAHAARMDLDELMTDQAEAFWPEEGSRMSRYRPYVVRDGVLHVPVQGSLLDKFPFAFSDIATGYEYIEAAVARGMGDPDVLGIALDIDSPGGVVAGNFDLVDRLYSMRGTKPIRAVVNEHAFSAAYSIASVADHIVVARTGGVGSIGVLTMHVDQSKRLEQAGLSVTLIHSGAKKVDGNRFEPLSESVREDIQRRIDASYDIFVATVARNRGISEDSVRATEAATFMPSEAIANGLADEIGASADAIAAFAALLTNKGDRDMATKPDTNENEPTITVAAANAAQASAVEAAVAEATADAMAKGVEAERARIKSILESDAAKTRPRAALNTALRVNMSAADAADFLATLPEEAATESGDGAGAPKGMFKDAMNNSDNPDLGTGGGKSLKGPRISADYLKDITARFDGRQSA